MAEVPGLDRKINAWLYRHDRPSLQFPLQRLCVRHASGLPHALSGVVDVNVQTEFMCFFFLFHAGNLHATYVIEVSQRSGP